MTHLSVEDEQRLDRMLLFACASIWLAVLGSGVAATVALVDLGRGHPTSSGTSDTPWLLYGVIAVSALVIAGSIPLLLRARRTAIADPHAARPAPGRPAGGQSFPTVAQQAPTVARQAPTQRVRAFDTRSAYPRRSARSTFDAALPAKVDRLWLRCAVVIACAVGIALLAVGIATYLMAVGHDLPAWIAYGATGLVTLAMPVIPLFYLRELHELLEASGY
jgi:Protein of unknown function (DUF2561)